MWLHRRAAHLLLLISVLGTPLLARGQVCAQPQLVLNSANNPIRDPAHLVDVGGTLYFTLKDPGPGIELWKSNGTPTGTAQVVPALGWPSSASLDHFTAVGSRLFFSAVTTSPALADLWTSDGTRDGTVAVLAFDADGLGLQSEFTAVGSLLFFSASGQGQGYELWWSDGTPPRTKVVMDIRQGSLDSNPTSLTVMNGQLFFVANDGNSGNELWKSTGTTGAVQVKDIRVGPNDSLAASLTVMGDWLYFTALDETTGNVTLWKSNGTDSTVRVAPNRLANSSSFSNLTAVGDKLFFQCATAASGDELWVTDGTEAGTQMVKDIQFGPNGSNPHNLVAVGKTLFFVANDGSHGPEPWRSDGTDAGTQMVADFYPNSASPSEPKLVAGPGVLVAQITDNTSGSELWKVDATKATRLTGNTPMPANTSPRNMTISGDKLYFVATHPTLGNVLYMLPLGQVDCLKPAITCPPDRVLEQVSSSGTFYESPPYQVSDDAVVPPAVSVEPQVLAGTERLRGMFGFGPTPITLTATDPAGNSQTCTFTVTVQDTTPPTLLCPDGKVEQEATGPETRPYFFALAYDAAVPQLTLDYHGHPPGSVFPLGDTPVYVTVSDGRNPPAECRFTVSIHDTVPPRITCPKTLVREARTPEDLLVHYEYQLVEIDSPVVTPTPALPSGSQFPVGVTEVTLEARDAAGLTDSCKFSVSITDPEPPTLSCPEPLRVTASQPEGAVVDFQAVADDNLGADSVEVSYSQDPGTLFPVGETHVTITAKDQGQHSVNCTFPVTVSEYVVSDGSCQAAGPGGALGWLLVVLLPVWARRRTARVAR